MKAFLGTAGVGSDLERLALLFSVLHVGLVLPEADAETSERSGEEDMRVG